MKTKKSATKYYPSEHWTQDPCHSSLMLIQLSICLYVLDFKILYCHALLTQLNHLNSSIKWSMNKRQIKGPLTLNFFYKLVVSQVYVSQWAENKICSTITRYPLSPILGKGTTHLWGPSLFLVTVSPTQHEKHRNWWVSEPPLWLNFASSDFPAKKSHKWCSLWIAPSLGDIKL